MSVLTVDHHGKLVTIDQHTEGRRTRALKAGHHRTRVGHHGRLDIVIHHRVTDLKAKHRDPSSRDRSQSRSSWKGRHRDPSSRDRSQSRSSRKGRRRDPSSRDRSQSRSSWKGRHRDPSSRDRSQSRSSWKGDSVRSIIA